MNTQDTIEAQALLNHYQYDRAGYLDACENAGINTKEAASFADEVYTLLQNDSRSRGDLRGLGWIIGGLLICAGMLLTLWLVAIPLIDKIIAMKP